MSCIGSTITALANSSVRKKRSTLVKAIQCLSQLEMLLRSLLDKIEPAKKCFLDGPEKGWGTTFNFLACFLLTS